MDAWETLRSNSNASEGSDVWTLINTQVGGGEFVCLLTKAFKTVLTETELGHNLITRNNRTRLVETLINRVITKVNYINTNFTELIDTLIINVSNKETELVNTDENITIINEIATSTELKEQT